MKNIPTVTIGIPAYNEEKNISYLLHDLLKQKRDTWRYSRIIILHEGTDRTAKKARQIKFSKITIISRKERTGKALTTNEILRRSRGDIVVLFDADIRLANSSVITNIVEAFGQDKKIMVVGANKEPFAPKNFLQRGIYSTFRVFYKSKIKLHDGNNVFGCQGGCIGVRKAFAKHLRFPDVVSEDAYIYLLCIKEGYKFKYVDNAVVYYKMASTYGDFFKQLFRSTPESVHVFMHKYFGHLVDDEFHRPFLFYISSIAGAFLDDPLPTLFIMFILAVTKPFLRLVAGHFTSRWPIAMSTKALDSQHTVFHRFHFA